MTHPVIKKIRYLWRNGSLNVTKMVLWKMNLCTVPARDRWRCLRPTWLSCEEGARTQPAAATAADGWPALQQQWPACQTQTARRARRRRHHHQGCWLCHYSRFGIRLSINWQFLIWHFWFPAWNFIFFGPNTFIWNVLNVPLVNFFKNVSQFLPNPGFRSIQVKKCLFSKGHIFGILILVS